MSHTSSSRGGSVEGTFFHNFQVTGTGSSSRFHTGFHDHLLAAIHGKSVNLPPGRARLLAQSEGVPRRLPAASRRTGASGARAEPGHRRCMC